MPTSSADAPIDPATFTPDTHGVPTSPWAGNHMNEAADPVEVNVSFPGHKGAIAKGLLRDWMHADDKQRHSAELQETFDSVNRDILGADTEPVFPNAKYPAV